MHSLIPTGGRHRAGGAKKELQRREGKREAGRATRNPDKVLHTLGYKEREVGGQKPYCLSRLPTRSHHFTSQRTQNRLIWD